MKELYRGRYISFIGEDGDESYRCYGRECWDKLVKYDMLEPVTSPKERDRLDALLTREQISWLEGKENISDKKRLPFKETPPPRPDEMMYLRPN